MSLGSVVHDPRFWFRHGHAFRCFSPISDEIRQDMRLDCIPSLVVYVEGREFDPPLRYSSRCVGIIHDGCQWSCAHNCHWMLLEIVPQFPAPWGYSVG